MISRNFIEFVDLKISWLLMLFACLFVCLSFIEKVLKRRVLYSVSSISLSSLINIEVDQLIL